MNLAQLRRFIGNPDAYALQHTDGTWHPERKVLDNAVLAGHLAHRYTVGTYVGHRYTHIMHGPLTVARTLVLDFDSYEEAGHQASAAHFALEELGVPRTYMGVEFSGNKGQHVWVVLQNYVPNAELRRLGRAALALADLPASTEVFPKQDEVTDLGNLIKLPHGIHQVTGKENDFLSTHIPQAMPPAIWARIVASLPEEQRARHNYTDGDNRFPCLSTIQRGVQEGGRNIQLLHLAAMFRRHGADGALVDTILNHINKLGEPLGYQELEGIVANSANTGPICSQLPQDMQDDCGENCIKARLAGLTTRPGQVRGAQEGEAVVVTVGAREDDRVSFKHHDIELARARLRGPKK